MNGVEIGALFMFSSLDVADRVELPNSSKAGQVH
jgi:hypothetical protein